MGIYSNGINYGIRILQQDVPIFEKINNKGLNETDLMEIKTFYQNTSNIPDIKFLQYIECCTTYSVDDKPFMMWEHININEFNNLISI